MAETSKNVQQRGTEAREGGEPCDYIIHPQPKLSEEELSRTGTAIREIAGPDVAIEDVIATGMRPPYLMFWQGALSDDQADEVRKLEGVREALPTCLSARVATLLTTT